MCASGAECVEGECITEECTCAGRQCGDDGCGRVCGYCGPNTTCNPVSQICEATTPDPPDPTDPTDPTPPTECPPGQVWSQYAGACVLADGPAVTPAGDDGGCAGAPAGDAGALALVLAAWLALAARRRRAAVARG